MFSATILRISSPARAPSKSPSKAPGTDNRVVADCQPSDVPPSPTSSSGVLDILAGLVIGLVLCVLVIH
jgi:hypothetical protein